MTVGQVSGEQGVGYAPGSWWRNQEERHPHCMESSAQRATGKGPDPSFNTGLVCVQLLKWGPETQNYKAHSLTAPVLSSAGHTKSLSFTENMLPFPPCPRGVARRSSESLWTLEQPQDLTGTASGRELLFTLQPHRILVQPTSIFIVHPLPHTLYNLQPDSLYSPPHTLICTTHVQFWCTTHVQNHCTASTHSHCIIQ